MAALPDGHSEESVVELRNVNAESLELLLEEESTAWRAELNWDFSTSSDLVRRFVHMQALSGFALLRHSMKGSHVNGYSYYVCEEGKGLIGDLFVCKRERTLERENALLEAALGEMWRTPGVRRVEAQLMLLESPLERAVPYRSWLRTYPRVFMEAPMASVVKLPVRNTAGVAISSWTEARHEETARLIATAYQEHIDSQINDQYRTPIGARRFLTNIVQYPGCGNFFAPASFAATGVSDRGLCGISLASLVAPDIGHITQVCVSNRHRETGLGYELMRRSLLALAAHGCRSVSLTVTTANEPARRLYERMGFVKRRSFAAYVWEP
jgi:ribosomal protein S18 acetylase RimI-like enzyme